MATTLQDLVLTVRYLIADTSTQGTDLFTYETSALFTITEESVIAVSTVYINAVEQGSGDWSYDSSNNKITISASLSSNDSVEVIYTYYPNNSITDIQNYIQAALVHISANNYKTFIVQGSSDTIYPDPNDREKNLIALIASILIEPDNVTYSLPDMKVFVPKDLPTHDKIRKTIAGYKKNTHGDFFVA